MKQILQNMNQRDRRAVVWGAALLAVLLGGRFVVLPWADSWQAARASTLAAQTELAELDARLQRLQSQRRRLTELFGVAATRPLPSVERVRVGFVATVEKLMTASGLKIQSVLPLREVGNVEGLDGVVLMTWQVETQCQISQLAHCLAQVREAEQLILIDRLSATAVTDKPGQVNVSLVLATLARREAKSP